MPYSLQGYSHTFLLFAFADGLSSIFSQKSLWNNEKEKMPYERYRQTAYYLKRKGYIKISNNKDKKILALTKKGRLELLLAKASVTKPAGPWDKKWRVIFFDIPLVANLERDKLRRLLKSKGFFQAQASVYVNPYPLNRDAVSYLKSTGLIKFIRLGRLEELDDDSDLRKNFGLK